MATLRVASPDQAWSRLLGGCWQLLENRALAAAQFVQHLYGKRLTERRQLSAAGAA
jgi:hypothetical protein